MNDNYSATRETDGTFTIGCNGKIIAMATWGGAKLTAPSVREDALETLSEKLREHFAK